MTSLKKSLQDIGFSDKKALMYVALLELGKGSVIDIAKKSSLKRTTVYNLLPEMIREGFIKTGIQGKKRFYFIEDVRQLGRNVDEQKRAIENLLPELRAVHNVLPQKPRITYYEGMGGMKELYQDTLDCTLDGGTILSYTGLTNFYQLMPYEYYRWYVGERVRKKIRLRAIAYDSQAARDWETSSLKDLREIKIITSKNFIFNADTEIYANKVALVSYRENFMGVIIESKEINEMQRSAFELMWNALT
ncbi:MAG: helix-turn-helix domain-containing protein [Patescibacteria group bacterium]